MNLSRSQSLGLTLVSNKVGKISRDIEELLEHLSVEVAIRFLGLEGSMEGKGNRWREVGKQNLV